jgi:hypothetical protein
MRNLLLMLCLTLGVCIEGAGVAAPTPSVGAVPAPSRLTRLAVLDVELSGDLGGPELAPEHEVRLRMATGRLREALKRSGRYQLLDNAPAQDIINRLQSQQRYLHDCNGCDLEVGRELRADQVMVAWVNRVSGLILTLSYEIHDVATGQIAARKSFDFRGDNDTAWQHAIDYMVRDLSSPTAPS